MKHNIAFGMFHQKLPNFVQLLIKDRLDVMFIMFKQNIVRFESNNFLVIYCNYI